MKKILSLILALALSLSLAVPALAVEADQGEQAAWELYYLGLFRGTDTDDQGFPVFSLDQAPTRAQSVTMLVRLLGAEEEALAGSWTLPFQDVPDWALAYVGYAYAKGLTTGRSETVFDPNTTVSATEYLTFVLRALGYSSGTDFQWDSAWTLSDKLGITDGSYSGSSTAPFLRADVAVISRDALSVAKKGSKETILDTLPTPDNQRCLWQMDCVSAGRDEIFLAVTAAKDSPETYTKFTVNSATVNGQPCEITQYSTSKAVTDFYKKNGETANRKTFALAQIRYNERAANEAAKETVQVSGSEYPVLVYKLNCTGTLKDGTQVEELILLSYYFDGYGGPFA